MNSGDHDAEQQAPVLDEAEQLTLFENKLASLRMDRRMAIQIFAAAGGALALACGGSNNNANTSKNATATTAPAAATTSASGAGGSATAAAKAASPATGGSAPAAGQVPGVNIPAGTKLAKDQVFRWNMAVEPSHFDYNRDLYATADAEIWAGLVQLDASLNVVPDIAEKWEANSDASVYTFHLRKDSKWSNGQPVTAKDFDYSIRRPLNPATPGVTYGSFYYDIKGAEAYNTKKVPDDSGLGVKVVDDYTLQITLEGPRAYFPVLMAYAAALPAYKDQVVKYGEEKWTDPDVNKEGVVSNGPYKLTKWDHNKLVELTKNEGYWNAKNIKIDKISRPIIPVEQHTAAYENNELDFIVPLNVGEYKRVLGDDKLSKQSAKFNGYGTWYLVPEADKPPFDNVKVRQAIGHAINRDSIVKDVLQGIGQVAYTFNPPGTPGYNPNKYDEFTKFDAAMAKDLLKGTPYEGGKNWPKITMTQRNNEGDAQVAAGDAIIQMLGDALGMKIDHELGQPKETYQRMWDRKLQMIWLRWYMDYPDPQDEDCLLYTSPSPRDS